MKKSLKKIKSFEKKASSKEILSVDKLLKVNGGNGGTNPADFSFDDFSFDDFSFDGTSSTM